MMIALVQHEAGVMHVIKNYANKVMDNEYNLFMSLMHVSVSKHLFDEHFTVLWANSYFYELIGYDKEEYEELFHNHVDEYYHDDPKAVAQMGKVIMSAYEKKESGYEFECPMPVKGGNVSWIRVTGRFTDEVVDGIPVIYTIYTDITNLKNMQLELERNSEELMKALAAAEKANRAKSDFLSRMSHDIRTPMNAIVGMSEIAENHLDDKEKVADCLKKISISSSHLLGLINDVLDMSKIESGKMTINHEIMFMPEVIENIVAIIQPSVKEKGLDFSIRLHDVRHEYFYSDALRLRQVFINILSNAVKFTPEGGSIIMEIMEQKTDLKDKAKMKFVFSDNGIGIKPEFMEHIFDAFTRERDSRVDKTEGSGLGMAITKRIVEMLQGTIHVTSKEGEGSCFTIELLMDIASEPQALPKEFPDLKLLIVDDDEIMCEYMMQMFKELKIKGDWSNDGAEAVSKIVAMHEQNEDYDAIILDWHMPKQDGLQTARMIREKMGDKLPIMILSAYDWDDIAADARGLGIAGFLTKPVFVSTLLQGIQRYVLHQEKNVYGQEPVYDFSGKRFLLAEDNAINRDIAVELLSDVGAVIDCAADGALCVEQFNASPDKYYDLILMDIQMPVMDGYTAARKIRALNRQDAAQIPILAMTADVFQEDIQAAKEAGMNGHLAKPIDINAIKREISRFF